MNQSFTKGTRAAVMLVTSVRSLRDVSDEVSARQLRALMEGIIDDASHRELTAMVYALVTLAANPLDDEQLQDFALKVSNGILE